MDGGKVGVFEERDEVRFGGLLEGHDGRGLEPEVGLRRARGSALTAPNTAARRPHTTTRRTLKSCAISRTSRWKGSLRMRSSVDFWYRRISRSATVPGRKRWGFFTPPVAVVGLVLRADLDASCLRGALPEERVS